MRLVFFFLSLLFSVGVKAQFSLPQFIGEAIMMTHLEAIDMDGDGDLDILAGSDAEFDDGCSCLVNGGLFWYENFDSLGQNFIKHEIPIPYERVNAMVVGDMDGDGDPDIGGIINNIVEKGTIFLKNIDGQAQDWELTFIGNNGNGEMIMGDWDDDGDKDIMTVHFKKLFFFENSDGLGNIAEEVLVTDTLHGNQNSIQFVDSDLDNDLDIVCLSDEVGCCVPPSRIWHFENLGGNQSPLPTEIDTHNFVMDNLRIADFNQDNYPDYVYDDSYSIAVHYNEAGIYPQNTRQIIHTFHPDPNPTRNTNNIRVADFDLNGHPDILYDNPYIYTLELIYQLDDEFTDPPIIYTPFSRIVQFTSGDFDGDGDEDIIYSNEDGELLILYNEIIPSVNYPEIEGNLYWDIDENGQLDSSDVSFSFQTVELNDELTVWSNETGDYHVALNFDQTYDLSGPNINYWAPTTPSSYTINTTDTAEIFVRNFGYSPLEDIADIGFSLNTSILRCNRKAPIYINLANQGTTILSGTVQLTIDSLTTFEGASVTPDSIVGNTAFWTIEDLYPWLQENFSVLVEVPGVAFIDTELEFHLETDLISSNGTNLTAEEVLTAPIVCAYDPNDKYSENTGPSSTWVWVKDTLEYTIRFQNTGNDTAFTVRVEDILSSYLDFSTLRPVSASHDCSISFHEGGLLTYLFEDIQLPDSTTNYDGSQGYFKFRVQPKQDLPDSTLIENTAAIFFDYNPPIITNTDSIIAVDKMPFEAMLTPPACAGDSTGMIELDIDVDPDLFIYSWNTNDDGPIATGLTAGVYQVIIAELDGTPVFAKQYQLGDPTPISTNFNTIPAINELATGALQILVDGGNPPYFYDWDIEPEPTGTIIEGLAAGTYYLTLTDAGGCQVLDSVLVGQTVYSASLIPMDPSCFDSSDGSILANINPIDSTPFEYLWNDGTSNLDLENVPAGDYTFSLLYEGNLVLEEFASLEAPPALVISANSEPSLPDLPTGSATAIPSGGTPPYSISWSTTPIQSGPFAENLSAGTYQVEVIDDNGCLASTDVTIESVVNRTSERLPEWEVDISPNPASEWLVVSFGSFQNDSWLAQLYNSVGKKVFQWDSLHFQDSSINLEINQPSGWYYLLLMNDQGQTIYSPLIIAK